MSLAQTPPNKFSSAEDLSTLGSRHKRQRVDNSPISPTTNQQDEMMKILNRVLAEVTELRRSNNEIQKSLEFYIKSYEEIKSRITTLETEKLQQDIYINKLEGKIDELERYSRSSCIEIRGIPPTKGETKQDLCNVVEKLHTKIKNQFHSSMIKDIYRLKRKSNGDSPVVVDFTTNLQKINTIQAVKRYNVANTTNRLNTSTLDIDGNKSPVYVSEFLTPKGTRLFFLARELAKTLKFDFCWTANGRILLRKSEGSPPIVVTSEKQIEDLKQKN